MIPVLAILIIVVLAAGFGAVLLYLVSKVGPRPINSPVKQAPYECGIIGIESKTTKVSVKFYLTAILFVLFDIELIFLYPWALIYSDFLESNALLIFAEMMIFVLVLFFGLFYIWKSKALEWD